MYGYQVILCVPLFANIKVSMTIVDVKKEGTPHAIFPLMITSNVHTNVMSFWQRSLARRFVQGVR